MSLSENASGPGPFHQNSTQRLATLLKGDRFICARWDAVTLEGKQKHVGGRCEAIQLGDRVRGLEMV